MGSASASVLRPAQAGSTAPNQSFASSRVSPSTLHGPGSELLPSAPGPTAPAEGGSISDTSTNVGSAYTSLAPYRLVDTRPGSGYYGAGDTLGAGGTITFPVTGEDGVPGSATAAALNVTVTGTTGSSYLSLYPAGGTRPLVSNLNWSAGETIPNLVIVPLGTGGEVTAYNHSSDTNVVVDLEGYFTASGGGSDGKYVALTPARIVDTRPGSGEPYAGDTLGAGTSLSVQVSGEGNLPAASDIDAALLNVTVTNTTAPSYLTVYPQGSTQPTASNLNWSAGTTIPNRVIVPVSSSGMVTLYNFQGSTDVVVDVDGYFTESTAPSGASLYTPVTPERTIDTRSGSGEPGSGDELGAGDTLTYDLSWIGSLGAQVTAVVTNVTVTDTTTGSYLTVYPGPSRPTSSDLNWSAGETIPNLTVAAVNSSSGDVTYYNHTGQTQLVVDIFGYFSSTATLSEGAVSSHNWSGYAETPGTDTAVTGTFTVPSLYTSDPSTDVMSEWVGIDGYSNSDLIQAGITEQPDASDPSEFYLTPWWEILPAAETPITTLGTISVGDNITIDIHQVSGSSWEISFDDTSSGQSFTTDQTYTGPGTSAEWIVEAPTNGSTDTVYTLADYTTTTFSGVGVTGSDSADYEIFLEQGSGIVSSPSAPGLGGTSFSVAYGSSSPNPPGS